MLPRYLLVFAFIYICSYANAPSGNDSVRNESPLCHNVCCVTKFYLVFGFLCACHLIYISATLSMFVAPLLNVPDLPDEIMPLGSVGGGGDYVSVLARYPV